MNISFTPGAWEDYQYWVGTHPATAKRIVALLKDIARSPTEGIGAPKSSSPFTPRTVVETHHGGTPIGLFDCRTEHRHP